MRANKSKRCMTDSEICDSTDFNAHTAAFAPLQVTAISLYHNFSSIRNVNTNKTRKDIAIRAYRKMLQFNPNSHDNAIIESLEAISKNMPKHPVLVIFSLWTTSCKSDFYRKHLARYSQSYPILLEKHIDKDTFAVEIWFKGKRTNIFYQTISTSAERKEQTEEYDCLIREINTGKRYWTHPETGHRFLILICGEINAVVTKRKGRSFRSYFDDKIALADNMVGVLNPSHTRFGPQAIREKQKHLSKVYGTTISCNNTFSFHWSNRKESNYWKQNACWQYGKEVNHSVELDTCIINTVVIGV